MLNIFDRKLLYSSYQAADSTEYLLKLYHLLGLVLKYRPPNRPSRLHGDVRL